MQCLQRSWALPQNSKHNEARFLKISMDLICCIYKSFRCVDIQIWWFLWWQTHREPIALPLADARRVIVPLHRFVSLIKGGWWTWTHSHTQNWSSENTYMHVPSVYIVQSVAMYWYSARMSLAYLHSDNLYQCTSQLVVHISRKRKDYALSRPPVNMHWLRRATKRYYMYLWHSWIVSLNLSMLKSVFRLICCDYESLRCLDLENWRFFAHDNDMIDYFTCAWDNLIVASSQACPRASFYINPGHNTTCTFYQWNNGLFKTLKIRWNPSNLDACTRTVCAIPGIQGVRFFWILYIIWPTVFISPPQTDRCTCRNRGGGGGGQWGHLPPPKIK